MKCILNIAKYNKYKCNHALPIYFFFLFQLWSIDFHNMPSCSLIFFYLENEHLKEAKIKIKQLQHWSHSRCCILCQRILWCSSTWDYGPWVSQVLLKYYLHVGFPKQHKRYHKWHHIQVGILHTTYVYFDACISSFLNLDIRMCLSAWQMSYCSRHAKPHKLSFIRT